MSDFSENALDIMVANAGRSHGDKSQLPDFDISRDIIQTNVIGLLNTLDVAMKEMVPRRRGQLVAIASLAGLAGLPGASAYSASKAAVIKLMESYSLSLPNMGIGVTTICPGFIDTPLTRKNNHSMPFLMSVEKGAKLIKKAIDSKMPLYIFPFPMKIVMWFLERMPRFVYRRVMTLKIADYSKGK